MSRRSLLIVFFISFVAVLNAETVFSTEALKRGIDLYGEGDWRNSILEFRKIATLSLDPKELIEAAYWIAMSEMNIGEYEAALQDIERVLAQENTDKWRYFDAMYQKGRILFYLGRQDEAIIILYTYLEKAPDNNSISAAYYWIGESLYSLGRTEEARSIFSKIIDKFPDSAKYEAASYRIALIDQKSVETELLKLLKWSHEESLKTVEEYQKRERSYEQAIIAYQKRITEMMKDTRLADLETANAELEAINLDLEAKYIAEQVKVGKLEELIRIAEAEAALTMKKMSELEKELSSAKADAAAAQEAMNRAPSTNVERVDRLLELKAQALDIKETIVNRLLQDVGNVEAVE